MLRSVGKVGPPTLPTRHFQVRKQRRDLLALLQIMQLVQGGLPRVIPSAEIKPGMCLCASRPFLQLGPGGIDYRITVLDETGLPTPMAPTIWASQATPNLGIQRNQVLLGLWKEWEDWRPWQARAQQLTLRTLP